MFERVLAEYGRLDFLINNAGIQIAEDTDNLAVDDFDKVLAVNLRGAFLCAQQALRHFLDSGRGGAIVNVSSVHQVIPKPRFLGYSVSKGGMQNLTHTLALEYAARGIRVNGIGPGATVTPINRSWIDDPVKRRRSRPHPDAAGGRRRGDGRGRRVPVLGRGGVHHRADALRRRRADALPVLRDDLVLGVGRGLPLVPASPPPPPPPFSPRSPTTPCSPTATRPRS